MKISLTDCGKRFNRDWIFRRFSYEFLPGQTYAITGPNGSGKSTLLQVIGGAIVNSEGTISYTGDDGHEIAVEDAYRHLAIAAPYLEVIEEMNLLEFLDFHRQFKPFIKDVPVAAAIEMAGLTGSSHKQIRYYSSGMKQRVKLIQAIFSDVPCLLLDEPCTNLDSEGIGFYLRLINEFGNHRTIVVSSNDQQEYSFCKNLLKITDYK
ncbi:MAG: ATP-binding cassette domain-containing protein [Sphingobacteriales bacterium]|nr:MAG: ATP-binding cassette domain-containing protein [Sphingobacteriales bacterium]